MTATAFPALTGTASDALERPFSGEFVALTFPAPEVRPEAFVEAVGASTSFVFAAPGEVALAATGVARLVPAPSADALLCSAAFLFADIESRAVGPAPLVPLRAFVALPFPDPQAQASALEGGIAFLPRWTYAVRGDEATATLVVPARTLRSSSISAEWARISASLDRPTAPVPEPRIIQRHAPSDPFLDAVQATLPQLRSGTLSKVVLSRRVQLTLAVPIPAVGLLDRLAAQAGWGCRVAVQHEGLAFVAVTPERLLHKRGLEVRTEALAGTTDLATDLPHTLPADSKDWEEHAWVVRDLASRLTPITSRLSIPESPTTRSLRHVRHLQTPIDATLVAPQHLLALAALLHPSPAVCGTPRDAALAWIRAHEDGPRGLYAGLLGWFDAAGDGDLWVGLRGALLRGNAVEQRVGAGIVTGSDPAGELAETEAKHRALLRALGGIS